MIVVGSLLNPTNQTLEVKKAIESCMDQGMTDKQDIYTKIVRDLNVPRPTVRRVARDLRIEMLRKIDILQARISDAERTSSK